jgi:hypothetical protein
MEQSAEVIKKGSNNFLNKKHNDLFNLLTSALYNDC